MGGTGRIAEEVSLARATRLAPGRKSTLAGPIPRPPSLRGKGGCSAGVEARPWLLLGTKARSTYLPPAGRFFPPSRVGKGGIGLARGGR